MLFTIWVTTRCSLSCDYCYVQPLNMEDMSYELAEATVDFIKKTHKKNNGTDRLCIRFHGGEPLLKINIIERIVKEILAFTSECNFSITTNGVAITPMIAKYLCDNHFDISISLDGCSQCNDKHRKLIDGSGSFNYVIKGIKNLKGYIRNPRIRMTISPDTVDELYDNVSYLVKCTLSPSWSLDFNKTWDKNSLECYENNLRRIYQDFGNNPLLPFLSNKTVIPASTVCLGGESSLHVYTSGEIYPCAISVGNRDYIIGDVVRGLCNYKNIKRIKETKLSTDLNKCYSCPYRALCRVKRCVILQSILTESKRDFNNTICEPEFIWNKVLSECQEC